MEEGDDEWMIGSGQNLLLGQSSLDFVALDHFLFGQHYP
jgi:hypothetical protein